MAVIFE